MSCDIDDIQPFNLDWSRCFSDARTIHPTSKIQSLSVRSLRFSSARNKRRLAETYHVRVIRPEPLRRTPAQINVVQAVSSRHTLKGPALILSGKKTRPLSYEDHILSQTRLQYRTKCPCYIQSLYQIAAWSLFRYRTIVVAAGRCADVRAWSSTIA